MLLYSFLVNPLGHDLSAYMSWCHENAHSGRSLFWGRASFPLATRVGRSGLASWSPLSRWYCGDLKVVYSWTAFASAKLTWPWKLKRFLAWLGCLKSRIRCSFYGIQVGLSGCGVCLSLQPSCRAKKISKRNWSSGQPFLGRFILQFSWLVLLAWFLSRWHQSMFQTELLPLWFLQFLCACLAL